MLASLSLPPCLYNEHCNSCPTYFAELLGGCGREGEEARLAMKAHSAERWAHHTGPFDALGGHCHLISSHRRLWAQRCWACGVYGHWDLDSRYPRSHRRAEPYKQPSVSLDPKSTPHPRTPEPASGSAGEVSGAAAALASSAPDLDSSRIGSKATTKPASVQHDCSQPSSESNFNKDFYTRTCCNCKFYLSHYTYLH